MNPLVTIAFWLSRRLRHVSRRCTRSWSVPWLALVRNVPPITPAQKVNGTVGSHVNENTCSFPAADAACAIACQPPGVKLDEFIRGEERAADVDHELDQVGPDDGGDAPFEGVGQREDTDQADRPEPQVRNRWQTRREDGREDERRREHPDPLRERAHDQKQRCGDVPGGRAEAPLQQRIRRVQIARGNRTAGRGAR